MTEIIGYNKHYLVNEDRLVADERGVDYIRVMPSQYKSDEEMIIKLVEQNWIFSKWWVSYTLFLFTFGALFFISSALTT